MNDSSRRKFLIAAGSGVAAAGVVAAAPNAMAAPASSAAAKDTTLPADATGHLIAYVRNVRTGEVAVMVDDREVIVHDKDLVARLARVAH